MTPPKKWPQNAEWARVDAIAKLMATQQELQAQRNGLSRIAEHTQSLDTAKSTTALMRRIDDIDRRLDEIRQLLSEAHQKG